jgi:hypothetical protein
MADITRSQNMGNEASGSLQVMIPPGMKYLAVLNAGTDNKIEIYEGQRSVNDANPVDSAYVVQAYQNTTFPIRESQFYTIVWRSGGLVSESKLLTLIFSQNNLGINFQGGVPGTNSNVIITGDQSGIAKSSQLPGSLESGNLKTVVKNTVDTKLVSELPAGTKQIGSVKVDALPDVTVAGVVTTTVNGNVNTNVQNTVNAKLATGDNVIGKVVVTEMPLLPENSNIIGKVALAAIVPVMERQYSGGLLMQSSPQTIELSTAEGVEVFIQSSYDQSDPSVIVDVMSSHNGSDYKVVELRPGDSFQMDLIPGERIYVSTQSPVALFFATVTRR